MANDYTQNKTPIFSGINDQPQEATDQEGSNASDLIAKVNQTLDWLNEDFGNLESGGGNVSPWDIGTTIYFDTANGDDENSGENDQEPKQTLQACIEKAKEKAITEVFIEQLDSNNISLDETINMDGFSVKPVASIKLESYGNRRTTPRLTFNNLTFSVDVDVFNYFSFDEDEFPYRPFKFTKEINLTIGFQDCEITCNTDFTLDGQVSWYFENNTIEDLNDNSSGLLYLFGSGEQTNHLSNYTKLVLIGNTLRRQSGGESGSDITYDYGRHLVYNQNTTYEGGWGNLLNFSSGFVNVSQAFEIIMDVRNVNFGSDFNADTFFSLGDSRISATLYINDLEDITSDYADKLELEGINVIDGSKDNNVGRFLAMLESRDFSSVDPSFDDGNSQESLNEINVAVIFAPIDVSRKEWSNGDYKSFVNATDLTEFEEADDVFVEKDITGDEIKIDITDFIKDNGAGYYFIFAYDDAGIVGNKNPLNLSSGEFWNENTTKQGIKLVDLCKPNNDNFNDGFLGFPTAPFSNVDVIGSGENLKALLVSPPLFGKFNVTIS